MNETCDNDCAGSERQLSELRVLIRELASRVDERDRLYDVRFRAGETAVAAALAAQEKAVSAALNAQEKQTSTAFLASEKAIVKAEDAQREYNIRSNEFRGQLDDQAKMLMPRAEVAALFKAMEEKVYGIKAELQISQQAASTANERSIASHGAEIASLRESRSESGGKAAGSERLYGYLIGGAGLLLGVVGTILAVLAFLNR